MSGLVVMFTFVPSTSPIVLNVQMGESKDMMLVGSLLKPEVHGLDGHGFRSNAEVMVVERGLVCRAHDNGI